MVCGASAFLTISFRRQRKYAGIRNISASIQAAGDAKQAAVKPIMPTKYAVALRPIISSTPAKVAVGEKPIP